MRFLINIYLIIKNTKNYKEGLKKFSQFVEYERFLAALTSL